MTDTVQPPTEIPDYAFDLINSIAIREGFSNYTITPAAGSNHGDGFQGIMIRITIAGPRKSSDDGAEKLDKLLLICKMPPLEKVRREMFNSKIVFEREIRAYEWLLPEMVKFQEEKGITPEQGFFKFPKCYGTYSDEPNCDYVIAMEDLKANGYEMWSKFETLNFQHAQLALKELGRYHSISFAIRDQRPDLLEEFRKFKPEVFLKMLENDMSRQFWEQNYETAASTLEPSETEFIERFQDLKKTYHAKIIDVMSDNVAEPFTVMTHGDFWNNNMMYLYANGNKFAKQISFIDWQMAQFCSPALDLSYFLYSSTEQSLRDEHYDDLLKAYHTSLSEMLLRLGSDAEKLFSFQNLQDQMTRFAQYGLLMAPMLLQVIVAKPADIPDLDELAKQIGENPKAMEEFDGFVKGNNPIYQERMSNVIRDFFARKFNL